MRVASFDIGINNMAVCVLAKATAQEEASISAWNLLALRGGTMPETIASLRQTLHDMRGELTECDRVLIERQTGMNPKMRIVAHALQMWCLERGLQPLFCDPRAKLRAFDGRALPAKLPAGRYARTKALGRWHAQSFLDRTHADSAFAPKLRLAAKSDDLADALVQGVSWLEEHVGLCL